MPKKSAPKKPTLKCQSCNKPALREYYQTALCLDCYQKAAYADFLEGQVENNRLGWIASQYNLLQQDLYAAAGGVIPLKQMMIPQSPIAPQYLSQQIKVSESNIGLINTGVWSSLQTGIQVIHDHGDKELANALRQLTEAVVNSTEINDELKRLTAEQLEFLVNEAFASKERQHQSFARKVMSDISQYIGTIGGLLTIWNTVQPLLQARFGM